MSNLNNLSRIFLYSSLFFSLDFVFYEGSQFLNFDGVYWTSKCL